MTDRSTSVAQVEIATRIARSLGGRQGLGAPVRRSFARSRDGAGAPSPVAEVISSGKTRGGPGGTTRLRLLLSVMWKAGAKAPYSVSGTPAWWARLIGIDDPDVEGARSVRNALRDLQNRGLLRPTRPGTAATQSVTPLLEDGSGTAYTPPERDYFRVPEVFWTQGIITRLQAPALVMLLCVLSVSQWDERTQQFHVVQFRPTTTKQVFGVSDSTRKRGLKELSDQGLLEDLTGPDVGYSVDGMPRNRSRHYRLTPLFRPPARPKSQEQAEQANAM